MIHGTRWLKAIPALLLCAAPAAHAVDYSKVLTPARPGLPLAHSPLIARRLAFELDQRIDGRVRQAGDAISPADVDEVPLDRRHRPGLELRGIDPGQRPDPRVPIVVGNRQQALSR